MTNKQMQCMFDLPPLDFMFKILRFQKCSTFFLYKSLLTQYCASRKIKKIEMGGPCGTYGGGEKRVPGFGVET